jgi:hypothetical protein
MRPPLDGCGAPSDRRAEYPPGHIVFRVEGGLVVNRMRWPLADELRRQVDFECSGPDCHDAAEILDLMRVDLRAKADMAKVDATTFLLRAVTRAIAVKPHLMRRTFVERD